MILLRIFFPMCFVAVGAAHDPLLGSEFAAGRPSQWREVISKLSMKLAWSGGEFHLTRRLKSDEHRHFFGFGSRAR